MKGTIPTIGNCGGGGHRRAHASQTGLSPTPTPPAAPAGAHQPCLHRRQLLCVPPQTQEATVTHDPYTGLLPFLLKNFPFTEDSLHIWGCAWNAGLARSLQERGCKARKYIHCLLFNPIKIPQAI